MTQRGAASVEHGTVGGAQSPTQKGSRRHTRRQLASWTALAKPSPSENSVNSLPDLKAADAYGLPGLRITHQVHSGGIHKGGSIIGELDRPTCCPACGSVRIVSKGRMKRPLRIYHIPVLNGPTLLEIYRRGYRCLNPECKYAFAATPEWKHPEYLMTKELVKQIAVDSLRDAYLPFAEQGHRSDISPKQIRTIRDGLCKQIPDLAIPAVRVLLIDDVHPHGYVRGDGATGFHDGVTGKLLMLTDGKDEGSIARALESLKHAGCQPEIIVIDGDESEWSAVKRVFPNAIVIYDPWHVLKAAVLGMDRVRRRLQSRLPARDRKALKAAKGLFTKPEHKLNPDEREALLLWLSRQAELRLAHSVKEIFFALYGLGSRAQAEGWFQCWAQGMPTSIAWAFQNLIDLVFSHYHEVFNYHSHGFTNGFAENNNRRAKALSLRSPGIPLPVLEAMLLAQRGHLTESRILELLNQPLPFSGYGPFKRPPAVDHRGRRRPSAPPSSNRPRRQRASPPAGGAMPLFEAAAGRPVTPPPSQPGTTRRFCAPIERCGPLFAAVSSATTITAKAKQDGTRGQVGEIRGGTGSEAIQNRDSRYDSKGLAERSKGASPPWPRPCPPAALSRPIMS